jgi:hypothetical protein
VIKNLGGQIVENFDKGCTYLITNKIRLTNKFLCGISLSKNIVDIKWIDECNKNKKFVDAEKFVLSDKENESKWNFSLKESINRSKKEKLLVHYSVFVTPKTLSSNSFIKEMIQAHSGTFLELPPSFFSKNILVISAKEETTSSLSENLSLLGFKFYNLEFFLISLLKQELLFQSYPPIL